MRTLGFTVAVTTTIALLGACGDDPADPIPIRATRTAPTSSATTDPPADAGPAAPVDAASGDEAKTFVGTLDATPATAFGGLDGHCNYTVTLQNVSIELAINAQNQVIGGTAKDLMVEKTVGTCMYTPQDPSQQSFAFVSMSGNRLTWLGGADNHPTTALTIDLTQVGQSYEAAATWQRTDLTGDLGWTVKTKITLGPR